MKQTPKNPASPQQIAKALEPDPEIRKSREWETCLNLFLDDQPRLVLEMGRNGTLMQDVDGMAKRLQIARGTLEPAEWDGMMDTRTGRPAMMPPSLSEAELLAQMFPADVEEEEELKDKERAALENLLRRIEKQTGIEEIVLL